MDKKSEKERINEMIEAIMKVARGDYSVQIKLSDKNDDLDSLAMGLNMMIDDLRTLIIERKRADEEIRKLSSAVEQSIDGMAIGDLEPKLTYVNDVFARMHGYSPEEMIGMEVVNLHNEEQMDEYKRGMNQIKTQGGWVGEIGHIRKDGTPFPTYMSVTLLKGADGKPTGILAVARDITERKRAEEELKKRNKGLKRFNKLAVGRELKIIELKKEINGLLEDLDKEPRYKIVGES